MSESAGGFLEVTFEGGRFAQHAAPVAVLAELATFQQLLLVVAKHLFKQAHPDRQRVPPGFPDAGQLYLTSTRDNCFTAVLSRPDPAAYRSTLFDNHVFEEARELSLDALASAAEGSQLPLGFPSAGFGLLGALGRQLMEDEGILVRGTKRTARVNQKSRERIAAMAQQPLEREAILEGEVAHLDDTSDRFWLRAGVGEKIEVPFKRRHRAMVVEALRDRPIVRVRVRGLVVFAVQKKVKEVYEIELEDHERSAEVQKLWARLNDLAKVPRGWLEGAGLPPTEPALAQAKDVLSRLVVDYPDIGRPKVFPTPDGGLQAEWVIDNWAAEARFTSEGGGVSLEATNGATHEERAIDVGQTEISPDDASAFATWLDSLKTEGNVRV